MHAPQHRPSCRLLDVEDRDVILTRFAAYLSSTVMLQILCRSEYHVMYRSLCAGGNLLLRLGTDNRATAERWLSCLESVGLTVLGPGEQLPGRPSTPAGSGAALSGETASGTTGARDQDRSAG